MIKRSVQKQQGVVRCNICDLQYSADFPEDRKIHSEQCKKVKVLARALKKQYKRSLALYEDREAIKTRERNALSVETDDTKLLTAQVNLLWAYFCRSAIRHVLRPGQIDGHPDFGKYISMVPQAHLDFRTKAMIAERYGRSRQTLESGGLYYQ